MPRVSVVSSLPSARAGLVRLLDGDPTISVAAASPTFARETDVMVVAQDPLWRALLDEALGMGTGGPGLILVSDDEAEQRFLASQSAGHVPWAALPSAVLATELRLAVHAVAGGLVVVHPTLLSLFAAGSLDSGETVTPLTDRERGVLDLLSRGFSNPEIAGLLGISEHTVKFHTSSLYAKLGVANRTEAVRVGIRAGAIHL